MNQVQSCPPDKPAVATNERRAWIRYPLHLQMFWQVLGHRGKDVWNARVEDVSARGVGVIADREFPPGTLLSIRIMGKAGRSRSYLIRVVRSTQLADGSFRLGCTFAIPLPPHELELIINGFVER